jgi:hypothetical protein
MIQRHLAIYSLLCTLFLTIAGSAHAVACSFRPSIQPIQQGIPGLGIPGQEQQDQPQQQQQPEVPPQQSPPPPSLPTPSPSIPQSPPPLASSPPEAIPQQQQQQQQVASEGIIAHGVIDSLILTPSATWIATGSWIIGVNNGAVGLVTANMTWYNDNGTASHTHEILNFRPVEVTAGEQGQQQQSILVQPADKSVSLRGVVDIGTNHRIVWNDVQSTIDIKKGGKILAISLNDAQTNNHFGGRPIFGIVTSFIRCSDVPGPNMEVLPPCLNIPAPVLSAPPISPPSPSAPTAPLPSASPPPPTNFTAPVSPPPPPPIAAAPPSASNATGKSPFDVLGGG